MRRIEGTTLGGFRCDAVDCDENGIAGVCLMVPARDLPIHLHNPLQVFFDVHVCRRHWEDVKREGLSKYLTKAVRSRCGDFFGQARGKPLQPDFDRTWLQAVATNSQRYLDFQQASGLVPARDAMVDGAMDVPFVGTLQ